MRHRGLGEGVRGGHIEAESLLQELRGGGHEGIGHGAADIVDHDVEAAEFGGGGVGEGLHRGQVGEIGRHGDGTPPQRADLSGDLVELLGGAGGDGDVGTGFGERERGGRAYAAARSGDDGGAAVEPKGVQDHARVPLRIAACVCGHTQF